MSEAVIVHTPNEAKRRWTDALLSLPALRIALFLLAIRSLVPPLFERGAHLIEHMDAHQFHGWELSNKITLLRYHQLPAWNPYWCGGTLGVAAPEDIFFAPDNILRLLFDVEVARHLSILLGLCLAGEGTFRLARAMGSSAMGSMVAGLAYLSNPMLGLWTWVGFWNFIVGFGLLPWVCWCVLLGVERPAYRYWGAFFFAWIFLSAGTYSAPYTLLSVLFVASGTCVLLRRPGRWFSVAPIKSTAILGAVFVLLVLVKLVPLLEFFRTHTRVWNVVEQYTATQIIAYFHKHTLLLVLAALAVLTRDRWSVFCALGAGTFFVLSMGDFDPLSPFHLLKQLPLFKQLRSPERHVVLVFLFAALGAARALTLLEDGAATALARLLGARSVQTLPSIARGATVLVSALLVVVALGSRIESMTRASAGEYQQLAFTFEPAQHFEQPFRQHRGNRRDAHVFPAMNMGSLYCITGVPVQQSALLRADLPQEEFALDPSAATVERVRWTPNELTLRVRAARATRVVINQNHDRHWRSSVGTVVSHEGLLAIDVPPGDRVLSVRFVDRSLQASLLVSAATLIVLLSALAKHLRSRARETLASLTGDRREPP